jgi:hypothetical protein
MKSSQWRCMKCNKWIDGCIDRDYHDNIVHPNFNNPYVMSWWNSGRPGMSPYD